MEEYPHWPNLAAMMFGRAREWPDRPMLRAWRDGAWRGTTWAAFARQAASVARALRAAGVMPGDRVVLVSENRPEVTIAETALLAIRAVPVPTYTTHTAEDHAHVLRDSGARVAIVSTQALAARVAHGAALSGGLDRMVVMDGAVPGQTPFADLAAGDLPPDDIAAEVQGIDQNTLACLIYTSGTGGTPKGVMLPHRCILSNCRGAFPLLRSLRLHEQVYLSFLPVSHSYAHLVDLFFLPSCGTEIVFARGVEHLATDMQAVRPTIMTVVPRILELIRARILAQVQRQPAWRQALFERAMATALRRLDGRAGALDRVLDPVLGRLVRRQVMERFGGRFHAAMSGGARLDPEVGRFFQALGVLLMQGYGQTEAGPVISANPPEAIRIETVGVPLEGVDLQIAPDGEILVRGDLVMDGYWNQPVATAEVIHDGWLHTGDVGVLDRDGYLRITDRKKDLIVLSGGENVSPAKVEGLLMAESEIAQAVVAGDGQPGLCALIVAAEDCDEAAVAAAVGRANRRVSVTERVRHHCLVEPFTLENGLLTPTQKIRRALVLQRFREELERLQA